MKIGYARVSTQDQNLDLQLDALKKAGCDNIFTDKTSGAKFNRGGLDEAMKYLREGDTLSRITRDPGTPGFVIRIGTKRRRSERE